MMENILTKLQQTGVTISIVNNNLRFAPKDKITPELVEEIKKNKAEIVDYLKDVELVQNMPLDTFAGANLVLKVASKVLGEDILFVSSDETAKKLKDEGFIVYTAQELKTIVRLNPSPETLKAIHEVKNVFPESKVVQ